MNDNQRKAMFAKQRRVENTWNGIEFSPLQKQMILQGFGYDKNDAFTYSHNPNKPSFSQSFKTLPKHVQNSLIKGEIDSE